MPAFFKNAGTADLSSQTKKQSHAFLNARQRRVFIAKLRPTFALAGKKNKYFPVLQLLTYEYPQGSVMLEVVLACPIPMKKI
ncbi:hypothetical protein WAE56_11495 [Iodobacter sp. LRB]|uniref:hypothetical protein n=1 Tax=unclassified Iodobacter TaxID=235634 RepID=UPI000C0CF672|nr:hypothetical protein [Iodobacter sp. BJB302]PHV01778.1 hypothetical protein CSQ88_10095 [Iodobacter sp. BJB302]